MWIACRALLAAPVLYLIEHRLCTLSCLGTTRIRRFSGGVVRRRAPRDVCLSTMIDWSTLAAMTGSQTQDGAQQWPQCSHQLMMTERPGSHSNNRRRSGLGCG